MDVQFSGAVDFTPLLSGAGNMAPSPRVSAQTDSHTEMLQSQQSILGPLSGGDAAMAISTELALNAGLGANINIWV